MPILQWLKCVRLLVRGKTWRSYFYRADYHRGEGEGASTEENKETSSGAEVKHGSSGSPEIRVWKKVLSINSVTLGKYFPSLRLNCPSCETEKSVKPESVTDPAGQDL